MALKPCITCGRPSRGSRCKAHTIRNGSTRTWRQLRAQILYRDAYRCALCPRAAQDVHHIIQLADGESNDPSNLRSLCADCHAAQH